MDRGANKKESLPMSMKRYIYNNNVFLLFIKICITFMVF